MLLPSHLPKPCSVQSSTIVGPSGHVSIETRSHHQTVAGTRSLQETASCRDPRTLETSCTVFNKGKLYFLLVACSIELHFVIRNDFTWLFINCFLLPDFNLPRPPDTLVAESIDETNSSHFLTDDSSQTSFLIQMFLSELQENPAPELCPQVEGPLTEGSTSASSHVQEEREMDSDMFCSGFDMFPKPIPSCAKPHQTCLASVDSSVTATSMLNPLDDPLVSSFSDISMLESNFLQIHTDPIPLSTSSQPNSPSSLETESVAIDVQTVLSSNVCGESNGLFDLSQCVSMLTDSSTSTTPQISIPSSPACPSPFSASLICESSPAESLQVSSLLKDLDFSSLSGEDLENVISSVASMDSKLCSSASSVSSSLPSPSSDLPTTISVSNMKSRKRKLSDESVEFLPVMPERRLSSDSASSLSTVSEPSLTVQDKKKIRRDKNNAASVVSRAKRRQRHQDIQAREKELEVANAELRDKVDFLTTETQRLRNLLLHKLSQK